MDKFPEIYNPSRLNQEEAENMNRLITNNEIELLIKKGSQQTKVLDQIVSQVNF